MQLNLNYTKSLNKLESKLKLEKEKNLIIKEQITQIKEKLNQKRAMIEEEQQKI